MPSFYNKNLSVKGFTKSVKIFAVLFLTTLLSVTAVANVYNVTNTTDGLALNQLRGAILDADGLGGTHTINVAAGTYTLTLGQITFGNTAQNITIIGAGAATTIINMTGPIASRDRLFFINPTGATNSPVISISGITFQGGYLNSDPYGGAAICAGGGSAESLTITNCIFDNNILPANAYGGAAVCMQVRGNLTIDNSTFTNNVSNDADGGAILFIIFGSGLGTGYGTLNVTNSTFTNNSVVFPGAGTSNGGALAFTGQAGCTPFNATINNNTFTGNTADGLGGAISANNSPNVSIPQIHFNRIVNNISSAGASSSGLHFVESSGSVNAENNWWGCNTNPVNVASTAPCNQAGGDVAGGGALDADPWLQLKTTASPAQICTNSTSTFTTSFLTNSDNTAVGLANLTRLIGLPVNFVNPFLGTLSGTNPTTIQSSGTASITYTSGVVGGNGSVNAVVDNISNIDVAPAKGSIFVSKPVVANPGTTTGTVNIAFSQNFVASAGVAPYTYSTSSTLPANLTLSSAGVLSGNPVVVGTYPIVVNVVDAIGCTGTGATYNLVLVCQVIPVTNPVVTTGTVGTAFSQTFTSSNTIGAIAYTLNSGSLPTGLSLSAAGVLSGTPTQFGTFPITVKVTDANGCTGIGATYNLVISCQTITVTNPGVTTGTNGTAFSQTFTQTGALGGATFTTSSSLPNGLSLSTAGVLSGTPSAPAGTYPITVVVTDGNVCTGTGAVYNLVISCQAMSVTNPGVTTGQIGVPFSQTFTQTGGIGAITFSTVSALPTGLSLSSAGVLSGTPGAPAATFPIVVRATDANGCFADGPTYNLVISACPTITVTNPAVTTGTTGTAFSETFTASGGTGPYTFTTSSTLPTGLSVSAAGVLSGTPTQSGTFPIVVTATDANSCAGNGPTYNLVINCPPITVSITGGGTFCGGTTVTLTATAGFASYSWARFASTGYTPLGITTPTLVVTQSGNYQVTVTDAYGCTAQSFAIVEIGDFIFTGAMTAGDASQATRLFLNGVTSTCATPKACPGTGGTGPFVYDLYTVTNNNPNPVCAVIALTANCTEFVSASAYQGSFDPLNNCTNYLGDLGVGILTGPMALEVTIPGGANIVIKVNNVQSGQYCNNYRLVVDIPRVAPAITAAPATPVCAGTPVTLTASVANSYLWSPGGATTQSITVSPSTTTTYTVTLGYGNNGCTATASQTVTVNPNPVVSIIPPGPTTICAGSTLTLTASATCNRVAFSGLLAGSQEVPPNASTARGLFYGTFNSTNSQLTFTVIFNGLTGGAATAAHIHNGAVGVSGPVIVPLPGFPAATSGTYTNTFTLSAANAALLLAGNTYVNIHNATFPGGELRGQVTNMVSNGYTISGPMNGGMEVPSNASTSTGNFAGTYNDVTNQLSVHLIFNNLTGGTATAAHIHAAAAGTNGPVIINFPAFPSATSGNYSITAPVPAANLTGFMAGNTYVNIHNATFPGGEIRGQIAPPAAICPSNTYFWSPGGATTQSITVSTANPYTVTVTDGSNCSGSASTVVNVNPVPVGSAAAQTICSGGTTSVTLNATTPAGGTTYSYTAAIQTAPAGGTITGHGSGTTNPIAQTLINTGTTSAVIRYTVIPSYTNGGTTCIGAPFTVDVTVTPILSCPGAQTRASNTGVCTYTTIGGEFDPTSIACNATSAYTVSGATTGSGTASLANFIFNNGVSTVTWTVTDAFGNTASCSFTVTVTDTQKPIIDVCPAPVIAYTSTNNPGECKASNVQLGNVVAHDNCPGALIITYTPVGDYPVGVTTVTWTVTDVAGNTASCTQLVTVIDDEKPVITCPAPVTVNNDPGQCYATGIPLGTATATDNCGISTIVFTQIVQYPVGTTVITYTATDTHGNTQTCTQLVTVIDNEKPTITCPADVTVNNTPGFCANNNVVLGTPTATDNCPPPHTFTNDHPSPIYPVGTTVVTWTVTDAHGNTQTCVQNVTVLDTENPTVTCIANQTRSTNTNTCIYTTVAGEFDPASSTDNCAVTSTTYTVSGATSGSGATTLAGFVFNLGTSTVTWKVMDAAGNSATCSFTVTVIDNQAPQIVCPASITQNNDNGICGAIVNYTLPFAADLCPSPCPTSIAGYTFMGTHGGHNYFRSNSGTNWTTANNAAIALGGNLAIITTAAENAFIVAGLAAHSWIGGLQNHANMTYSEPGGGWQWTNGTLLSYTNWNGGEPNDFGNEDHLELYTSALGGTWNDLNGSVALPYIIEFDCSQLSTVTQTAGIPTGGTFPVGTTTNTYIAVDASGNSASCSFTVTVVDAQAPTVTCVANQSRPANAGVCTYTTVGTEFDIAASGDNCAVTTTTYTVTGTTTGSGANTLAGFVFNKGVSTVTWTVADAAGNSATCSFTVTVTDDQKPTITCAGPVIVNNNPGQCSAIVVLTTPTGTDNCPGPLVFTNDHPSAIYPVGTTIVTWTVTDVSGNTQTCTQSVTVNDNENPVIGCAGNMIVLNDPGECFATVTPTPPTIATDNCGPISYSYVLSGATTGSGAVVPVQIVFNMGLTYVTWKITDPSGNSATCVQTVLIVDAENPIITCVANQTRSTDNNVCTYTTVGTEFDPTFSDNCSATIAYTVTGATTGSGASTLNNFVFNKGVSTVTWKATDPSGNSASCSFTVTVNDDQDPTVTCVGNQTRSTNNNVCTYTTVGTEFNPASGGDNCGITSTTYTVSGATTGSGSGSLAGFIFAKGTSTVTWKVMDAAGNSATCSFTVQVDDNQNPTISCVGNQTRPSNTNVCTYTTVGAEFNPTASGDNCAVTSTTYTVTGASTGSGANTLAGFVFANGTSTVTWTVMDAAGNSATCSFTVTVNDNQNPTISCVVNQTRSTDNNVCTYTTVGTEFNPAASGDNCGVTSTTYTVSGASTGSGSNTLAGFVFNKGTSTVIWKVMDASGNSATCSFTVQVNDNQKPTITCPANVTVNNTPGQCGNTNVNIGTPTTGDNCPGPLTVTNDHPSASYPVGVTIVTWTVTDVSGNTQTCTQTVTVVDNEKPTITCAGNMTAFNDAGQCYATVTLTPPIQTGDNCPGPLVVTNNAPVNSQYPVGVTVVTWTVTDVAGNTQTCTQNVTVIDNEKPIITCPGGLIVDNDPGLCGATITLFPATATDNCGILSIVNDHPSTSYPVGTTIVTWTATDIHGNTQTCTQSVTVIDVQNPTISCVGNQTRSTNNNVCTYTTVGSEFNPTASADNCAVTSTTYTVSGASTGSGSNTLAGFVFAKGTSTVTWKVMDAAGNSASCSFTVQVNDNQNPTISCVGNQTRPSNTNACTYTTVGAEFNPTASGDNCAITSTTYTVTGASTGSGANTLAGFVFANGTSTVTWTVMDAAGNSATCSFTVTVNDNQNPTLTCPGNQTRSTNNNVCTYSTVGTEFNPTTGDNCAVTSTTYTVTGASTGSGSGTLAGFVFAKGVSTVTWKVQDAAGNSATCSFTVTVNDTQKPTITCAPNVSVGNNANQCFATVILTAPTVSDNCPGPLVVTNNAPVNNQYPAGVTTVTWTVTDVSGNTQTCTQTVTVTINTTITSSVIGVGGTISPLGNTVVPCGGSQSYTMTANAGYVIGDIIVDGVSINPTPGITTSTYTFTNVTTNHTIAVSFKQIVTADPALVDVYITDMSNNPINTNLIPFNTVNKVKVRVQNLSFTTVPSGTVTVRVQLGDKLNINPGFNFATAGLNNEFTWSLLVSTPGAQIIQGVQNAGVLAELPGLFDQTASFDVISGPIGSSRIDADILTTNHNNATQYLVDANLNDNHAEVNPYHVLNPFIITSVTSTNVNCYGGSNGTITVTVTGGAAPYDFSKDNGATYVLAQASPYTFTGLAAGSYNIKIRDAVSQVVTYPSNPVVITQPPLLTATASGTNLSCNGGSNGTATVTPVGGTPGYTYLWSPGGQTTQSISGLALGTYTVTVTDSKGCTATASYTVTQPPVLVATASGTNVSCNGGNNGTATVTVTGGTAGYTYLWSPGGQTTQTITGLAAGTYTVTVTDSKGCTAQSSYTVTQSSTLVATASGTNVSCNGGNDGTATVTTTGGTAPYTYLWSPGGQTTQSISGLAPGTYSVTVTDANGCTATSSYTVTQSPLLTIAVTGHVHLTNACVNNGSITVTAGGGTSPYQYAIDAGSYSSPTASTTFTFTGLGSGLHTMYVKDSKGCIKSTTFTLTEPTISNLSLGSDINDNFFATNGEIEPIVYNISEINGKTASPVVLRVYKPSGYDILFSPSDVTVTIGFPGTTYALDNANWTRTDNIPGGYSEFTRNAPLPCFNLKNLKISLQRATFNKTLFNLNAVLFPAATEVDFSSNTNSITFVGN